MSKRPSTHRSPARFLARTLPGAKVAPYPGFIPPSLPASRPKPPSGPRWSYEIKHDGYRMQGHLRGGTPALFTRSGQDWTSRFRSLAKVLADLPANNLVLDGEVIVPDEHGVSDLSALQHDLEAGQSGRILYYAFDILHLDGFDLRPAALSERKRTAPNGHDNESFRGRRLRCR